MHAKLNMNLWFSIAGARSSANRTVLSASYCTASHIAPTGAGGDICNHNATVGW